MARAAKIVAPIADQHHQDYFEGGIFLILRMLSESPIATKALNAFPYIPELARLESAPLTQGWFAEIIQGPWRSTFIKEKREHRWPADDFLLWAKGGLLISHDDVVRNLRPPFSPGHEPVAHCNAAGAWWSFPQILAWAATRDPVEVARIGSALHFGPPVPLEFVPDGMTVRASDRGASVVAPTPSGLLPHEAILQSDGGRRKLVGWLAMVTALKHCQCSALASAEKEKWESCSCLGNAYDEVRRFGPIAQYPIPKYQPQPEYGTFSLEWSDEMHRAGAYRSDVQNEWPVDMGEKHQRSETPNSRPGRPKGSGSMAAKDAPLVKKMRRLLKNGKALSITSAAESVVDRAAGSGTRESKISRLVKRFHEPEKN